MNDKVKAQGGSEAGKVILILGIGCLVLSAIGCGTIYYFVSKARDFGADIARTALVKVVNDTRLPEKQKTGIISHIDRVTTAFKVGDMTLEEVGRLFEDLGKGPLLPSGVLYYVHNGYIAKSRLGLPEAQAARRISQRYARGAIEGQIPIATTNKILKMVQVTRRTPQGRSRTELKESLTDEEFAAFHKAIAEEVAKTGIPDEPYEIDIAYELGKVVDRALKR